MAIKKSELYSSLWKSCDELRGGMDASQYKDYVLVLLFVKYVSDRYAGQKDALLDIPKGGGFADMVVLKGDKEIGEKINKIIGKLAAPNELKGVIDVADFNDEGKLGKGKEMVDRLSNLVAIFNTPALDFRNNRAEGDDLLGDAYEYLMRHFATESGKSKGQFYTPAEVSRIMAKVIGIGSAKRADQSAHDPTCGSASLLLKAHDEGKSQTGLDLALYGQEMDVATAALARMNMILHGCPTSEIWRDNTLSSPHFKESDGRLKTFDFVVANFPFSSKAWSNGFDPANDLYGRFAYGIPPQKNGDFAFLLHILACLKSTGKGAVIHPHGVLFRGGAEATIRKEIVRRGFIKGIVGLPANLFYGTGIPACILVLDKENAHARKGIFMIDASKGFIKDGNKNRLRAQDIHKIVDIFTRQAEIPRYSRMVSVAEISDPKNDYNLNLSRYIDSTEPEDMQDIDGHLRGGIPDRDINDLDRYWQVLPSLRSLLFESAGRPGYSRLKLPIGEIKAAIFSHTEFTAFNATLTALFAKWERANKPRLKGIVIGNKPKALIESLSEELLATFGNARLIDPYDVYQHLMDYWEATMQDDVYMIVQEGWKAVLDGKPNTDLIPPSLIVRRYFAKEQAAIEQLEADRDAVSRRLEELDEEHSGDDALLADARTDKGKLTKASAKARLADIQSDTDAAEERKLLKECHALIEEEATAGKKVKDAQKSLDAKVAAKYGKLTETEIKTLVVDDKWLAMLADAMQSELDRVSQALTGRIRQLAKRYATPLPQLSKEVETLAARVDEHLKKMGAVMEVKPGYKQTEVGVIPEEWEVKRLGDIGDITSAGVDKKIRPGELPVRLVNYLDVYRKDFIFSDDLNHWVTAPPHQVKRCTVKKGDVFFTPSSETRDDIGISAVAMEDIPDATYSYHVVRLRFREDWDLRFRTYAFKTRNFLDQAEMLCDGSGTRYVISQGKFKSMTVKVPPLPEQTAIAAVLSDMDAEIAALEARRDKTHALKQGMMQELLTGRTRLV